MAVSTLSFRAYVSQLKGRRLGAFKIAAAKLGLSFDEYIEHVERGQKNCIDCREWKPRCDFNCDATRWDGLSSKCRQCQSSRGRDSHIPLDVAEWSRMGPQRNGYVDGNKEQARRLVNAEVEQRKRPSPDDLFCALCGHKGSDRRHEYHHHMGYAAERFFDVIALCTMCHHGEHYETVQNRVRNADGTFIGSEVSNGND